MAEETEQTVLGMEQETEVSAFIGSDGKLLDGWKDALLPEDLRGERFYDTIHDVQSMFKTAGHQAKRIGAGDKAVLIPDEKSTPEEVAAFHKAVGVPPTPNDYKMGDIPPELKEYYSDPLIAEARTELHKAGLNQKQFDLVMALDRKRLEVTEKARADSERQQEVEAEKIIAELCGQNKETMLHSVALGVENITAKWTPEKREALFGKNEGVNSPRHADLRPLLFEFLAGVGELYKEGSMADVEGKAAENIQAQIATLRASEAMKNPAHPEHEAAVKQLEQLYKKLNPGQ